MTEPDTTATIALETGCPRCGRTMVLALPPDCDTADAARLARLVLCDRCTAEQSAQTEQAETRLPYRDD